MGYRNEKVSASTVGWQIDHSFKVINGVLGLLNNAPTDKKTKLTLLGRFCLLTGYIPRGKGKAPKQVLPPEHITKSDLDSQLDSARKAIKKVPNINKKATFKHPFFGVLSKKQTLCFLETHTRHHLKIIRDILKSSN